MGSKRNPSVLPCIDHQALLTSQLCPFRWFWVRDIDVDPRHPTGQRHSVHQSPAPSTSLMLALNRLRSRQISKLQLQHKPTQAVHLTIPLLVLRRWLHSALSGQTYSKATASHPDNPKRSRPVYFFSGHCLLTWLQGKSCLRCNAINSIHSKPRLPASGTLFLSLSCLPPSPPCLVSLLMLSKRHLPHLPWLKTSYYSLYCSKLR